MSRDAERIHGGGDVEFCGECGRSMLENGVRLGRTQVEWMFRLYSEWGGSATHKDMGLIGSVYATCSYTRYWGLVENFDGPGTFRLTEKGYRFLLGEVEVESICWMFDKRVVEFDGPLIGVADILKKKYETYHDVQVRIREDRRPLSEEVRSDNVARRHRVGNRTVTRRAREPKESSPVRPCTRVFPPPVAHAPAERDLRRHEPRPKRGSAQSKKPVEQVRRDSAPKLTGDALQDYLDKKAGL